MSISKGRKDSAETKSLSHVKLKGAIYPNSFSFGVPLQDLPCSYLPDYGNVPTFLVEAGTIIRQNIECEGLFFKSGEVRRQQELKVKLEEGASLIGLDVHDVTSLVKFFLRMLPEPLIPQLFHDPLLTSIQLEQPDMRADAIQSLCFSMPAAHLSCLRYVMMLLSVIVEKDETNRMTPRNLAVVLTPCLIRMKSRSKLMTQEELRALPLQTTLIEHLINNAHSIGAMPQRIQEISLKLAEDSLRKEWRKKKKTKESCWKSAEEREVAVKAILGMMFDLNFRPNSCISLPDDDIEDLVSLDSHSSLQRHDQKREREGKKSKSALTSSQTNQQLCNEETVSEGTNCCTRFCWCRKSTSENFNKGESRDRKNDAFTLHSTSEGKRSDTEIDKGKRSDTEINKEEREKYEELFKTCLNRYHMQRRHAICVSKYSTKRLPAGRVLSADLSTVSAMIESWSRAIPVMNSKRDQNSVDVNEPKPLKEEHPASLVKGRTKSRNDKGEPRQTALRLPFATQSQDEFKTQSTQSCDTKEHSIEGRQWKARNENVLKKAQEYEIKNKETINSENSSVTKVISQTDTSEDTPHTKCQTIQEDRKKEERLLDDFIVQETQDHTAYEVNEKQEVETRESESSLLKSFSPLTTLSQSSAVRTEMSTDEQKTESHETSKTSSTIHVSQHSQSPAENMHLLPPHMREYFDQSGPTANSLLHLLDQVVSDTHLKRTAASKSPERKSDLDQGKIDANSTIASKQVDEAGKVCFLDERQDYKNEPQTTMVGQSTISKVRANQSKVNTTDCEEGRDYICKENSLNYLESYGGVSPKGTFVNWMESENLRLERHYPGRDYSLGISNGIIQNGPVVYSKPSNDFSYPVNQNSTVGYPDDHKSTVGYSDDQNSIVGYPDDHSSVHGYPYDHSNDSEYTFEHSNSGCYTQGHNSTVGYPHNGSSPLEQPHILNNAINYLQEGGTTRNHTHAWTMSSERRMYPPKEEIFQTRKENKECYHAAFNLLPEQYINNGVLPKQQCSCLSVRSNHKSAEFFNQQPGGNDNRRPSRFRSNISSPSRRSTIAFQPDASPCPVGDTIFNELESFSCTEDTLTPKTERSHKPFFDIPANNPYASRPKLTGHQFENFDEPVSPGIHLNDCYWQLEYNEEKQYAGKEQLYSQSGRHSEVPEGGSRDIFDWRNHYTHLQPYQFISDSTDHLQSGSKHAQQIHYLALYDQRCKQNPFNVTSHVISMDQFNSDYNEPDFPCTDDTEHYTNDDKGTNCNSPGITQPLSTRSSMTQNCYTLSSRSGKDGNVQRAAGGTLSTKNVLTSRTEADHPRGEARTTCKDHAHPASMDTCSEVSSTAGVMQPRYDDVMTSNLSSTTAEMSTVNGNIHQDNKLPGLITEKNANLMSLGLNQNAAKVCKDNSSSSLITAKDSANSMHASRDKGLTSLLIQERMALESEKINNSQKKTNSSEKDVKSKHSNPSHHSDSQQRHRKKHSLNCPDAILAHHHNSKVADGIPTPLQCKSVSNQERIVSTSVEIDVRSIITNEGNDKKLVHRETVDIVETLKQQLEKLCIDGTDPRLSTGVPSQETGSQHKDMSKTVEQTPIVTFTPHYFGKIKSNDQETSPPNVMIHPPQEVFIVSSESSSNRLPPIISPSAIHTGQNKEDTTVYNSESKQKQSSAVTKRQSQKRKTHKHRHEKTHTHTRTVQQVRDVDEPNQFEGLRGRVPSSDIAAVENENVEEEFSSNICSEDSFSTSNINHSASPCRTESETCTTDLNSYTIDMSEVKIFIGNERLHCFPIKRTMGTESGFGAVTDKIFSNDGNVAAEDSLCRALKIHPNYFELLETLLDETNKATRRTLHTSQHLTLASQILQQQHNTSQAFVLAREINDEVHKPKQPSKTTQLIPKKALFQSDGDIIFK